MIPKKQINTNQRISINLAWLIISFLLISNNELYSQNIEKKPHTDPIIFKDSILITNTNLDIYTYTNPTINLVSWFMGTKQTPNIESYDVLNKNRQVLLISSRIEPNRILIKSFLKKILNSSRANV